ncbi:TSC22 domain family protein 1 isoform X1 [Hyperolius riggenbachi]|uniref:TSC22 domain family protein 1 isoform X1 n=1 Tax=Hyperolius riggenbachi TaxID=752182 RepID=UPI0035A2AA5B
MHQPDPSADLSARKMAHPADVPRRGSGTPGTPSPLTLQSGPGVGGHVLSSDDYPPSMLVQQQPPPPPASSSSPGPQQHPPQTLNLMPQPLLQSGAQIKKKSGFQITSVTPAQISASMSSNNSIAEDTESYDDLDESHTEDLSSSEILDVSSRATDLGGPERSSSEETLNNFQEAETPGAVSPNQPPLHQHIPTNIQQTVIINGNVHHPHHLQHHHHHHHHGLPPGTHHGLPSASMSGSSQNTAAVKLATQGSTDSIVTTGSISSAPTQGTIPPMIRKASGPVSTGVNPPLMSSTTHTVNIQHLSGVTGPLPTGVNVNLTNVTNASNVNAVPGSINTTVTFSGNGSISSSNMPNAPNPAAGPAVGPAVGQQQTAPSTAVTSRFRVVKLDSSSEPFKKGRWTCMEFYDKENAAAASEGAAINKAVESVKQNPLEVTSERESTSGSSVSSNISTLSHYTESVGSGEMGAPAMQGFQSLGPQQMDFNNPLTQNIPTTNIPQSVSQPQLAQLQIHSQDATYSPQKQVGQAAPASINAAVGVQPTVVGVQPATVNILGVPSSLGHQQPGVSTMIPQQLPYPQQAQSIQTLPTVPQQQLQYTHQQTAPTQMTSGHVMAPNQTVPGNLPEYIQHPQMLQTAVAPVQSSAAGVGGTAAVPGQAQVLQTQMLSASVQPPPTCVAPSQPVVHAQTTMPVASSQVVGVGQQGSLPAPVHQTSASQSPSIMQQNVPAPSQVLLPTQGMQVGALAHQQPVMIAPQNPLLPTKPPTQLIEPAVQGMTTQHVPAVSPIPVATGVSAVQQLSTSVPPGISAATATLGPPPTVTQLSTAQNGSLLQSGSQAQVMGSLNIAQNMLQMPASQFLGPALIQTVASHIEDARRLMEHSAVGLPHIGEGASLDSNLQGTGSLLPLKSLPLTTPLVDGEDESSSGASVVAIDNKIEQAMDLVKSHLMYAVREEVEVLKEQIKELIEKNSQLEQENSLLKTLASPEQLAQVQAQLQTGSPPSSSSQPATGTTAPAQLASQSSGPSA